MFAPKDIARSLAHLLERKFHRDAKLITVSPDENVARLPNTIIVFNEQVYFFGERSKIDFTKHFLSDIGAIAWRRWSEYLGKGFELCIISHNRLQLDAQAFARRRDLIEDLSPITFLLAGHGFGRSAPQKREHTINKMQGLVAFAFLG